MKTPSELETFLNDAKNTTSRERLLAHYLVYNLKLSSMRAGVDLRVYEPDVDREGFDLVVESDDVLRKVQTKVVQPGAKTNAWDIHKGFLRPSPWYSEHHGLEPTIAGYGTEGAVLIMDLNYDQDELRVEYRYFDILILTAREIGLIPSGHRNEGKIPATLNELSSDPIRGRVAIPSWMFVRVKNTDALLSLLGLHSRLNSSWQYVMRNAAGSHRRLPNVAGDHENWRNAASEELASLIDI